MKKYKIGYIPGSFDLFHVGHLNLLRRAKERCDFLIVGIVSDELNLSLKGEKPYIPYEQRAAIVEAIKYVDRVVQVDFSTTDKIAAWHKYHYDCHFSGDDHIEDCQELKESLKRLGAEMEFFPYTQSNSSTKIKNDIKSKLFYQADYFNTFAVFDTLITRKVATVDGIFLLMQQKLQQDENYQCIPKRLRENFYHVRLLYDGKAWMRFCDKDKTEIGIAEIYKVLGDDEGIEPNAISMLMQLEFDTEMENCIAIPENIKKIKDLKACGKNVALISNTYFDEALIRKILINIDSDFTDIPLYVSSEYSKRKDTGDLYKIVQTIENVEFDRWVHCGDDRDTDIKVPESLGIKTIYYKGTALMQREVSFLHSYKHDITMQLAIGEVRRNRLLNKERSLDDIIDLSLYADCAYVLADRVPYELLSNNIAIYAAGKMGQSLYSKLKGMQDKNVVAWVDKNFKGAQEKGLPVHSPEILIEKEFDEIIVAVLNAQTAVEINKTLLSIGIDQKKIIWIKV
jgi:glycerol-3-phosphate cytidylyltransferase